jgi:hypothetical protein
MHHRHILSWLTIAGVPERNDYFYPKSHSMAYNEHLAERIKQNLESRKIKYIEKKMFGGVCLMVDDKMLMGVMKDQLMARVDPEVDAPKALKRKGAVTDGLHRQDHEGFYPGGRGGDRYGGRF